MEPDKHPVYRVIEEIGPDELFTHVNRRMQAFLTAGVTQYWAIHSEEKLIVPYRLGSSNKSPNESALLPDFEQTVEEFFRESWPSLPNRASDQSFSKPDSN